MSKTNTQFGSSLMGLIGVLVVVLLVNKAMAAVLSGSHTVDMSDAAIQARIAPVGQVNTDPGAAVAAATTPEPAATETVDGAQVYQSTCFACHGTGAAGAPRVGDQAAWADRIARGMDTLLNHALNGFNAMPPRGGNPGLSDDAIKAVVEYMVSESQ